MSSEVNLVNNTISLKKGDLHIMEVEVVDDENYPFDLTDIPNLKIYLTIKNDIKDTNAQAVLIKENYMHENTDLSGGIFHFKLVPLDTSNLEGKKYFADISIESSTNAEIKYTPWSGAIYLYRDIKN